jgi:hypothetical protein
VAELRTNWKRFGSMTNEQILMALDSDPKVNLMDDAFWANTKLVIPRSREDANVQKTLNSIEAHPRMRRMMKASATDIKAGRLLNTRELRQRHKQTRKGKDSRS